MIKFEKILKYANVDIEAPRRKTDSSAGYDMVAAEDIIIQPYHEHMINLYSRVAQKYETLDGVVLFPEAFTLDEIKEFVKPHNNKPTLIPTGYKVYMPENCSCELYVRSSSPLNYWILLANGVGLIDSDYADNPDNEGHIFFQVYNLSPFPIVIKKGETIGQAVIREYAITDDDSKQIKQKRKSGFGSTTKKS